MMTYGVKSKDNCQKHAEVFTPAGLVFHMLVPIFKEDLRDVDLTIFDPALGEGQFPCAELVWKLFYNLEKLDEDLALRILRSLYGVDIQAANVDKAREHLMLTLKAAYKFFTGKKFTRFDEARAIIEDNFYRGDVFKLLKQWSDPQLSLF